MTTRVSKTVPQGPDMWDLDDNGRRFAVGVDGRITYVGSKEECVRRLHILTRPHDREQQDKALRRVCR